jgi:hypothetical protein
MVDSELDNITSVEVTGPYSSIKVIGPPHVSMSDRGLTFATNHDEGICISFRRPVSGLLPVGWISHPSLTLTVAEPRDVRAFFERARRRLASARDGRAELDVEQLERDVVSGLSSAELRDRARVMGVERASEMSHDELVALLLPVDPSP